ncbi:WXG100 family type VII secretion target [Streptomyces sp. R28]|uniref:ESAT-6-like protein n=1 Tax=Streptomyces sp. R28 TaxID=3238628 RepID=A0AB39Q5C4_9ACTN
MAGQFRVTEDELTKLSGDINTVNGQLQGEIRRLNGVIDQIAGGWKGQAAQSYRQLQDRWNADAKRMTDILNDIKEAVDSTRSNYSASEEQQNSEISKIMSDFG